MGGGSSKRSKKSASTTDAVSSDTYDTAPKTEEKIDTESKTSDSNVLAAEDAATQEVSHHWADKYEYIQEIKTKKIFVTKNIHF